MSALAIVVASLLGSLHCVGMCGGFVALVGSTKDRGRALAAYQGARGATYVTLGALAGWFGAGLEHTGALLGLTRLAGPLMGLSLIVLALASLVPRQRELVQLGRPRPLARARALLASHLRRGGTSAALAAGLLTALLPCGWLWAYLLFAAGTGSPGWGAGVMGLFWLGTLPALFGVGMLAGGLGRVLGRHAPRISAAAMIVLGMLSLLGKYEPLAPFSARTTAWHDSTPSPEPAPSPDAAPLPPTDAPCH